MVSKTLGNISSRAAVKGLLAVDETWFRIHGQVRDAVAAWKRYKLWLDKRRGADADLQARRIIQFATGISRTAVNLYFSPNERDWRRLGAPTIRDLGRISQALHQEMPPCHAELRTRSGSSVRQTVWRVSLLTNLKDVPSPRFHLQVLTQLVEGANQYNISVAVHHFAGAESDRQERLAWLVAHEQPHGLIWFRLTPEEPLPQLPSVVIHGSLRAYEAPVVAHIQPDQTRLAGEIQAWLKRWHEKRTGGRVVIVSLPKENGLGDTIRNQRIDQIQLGVRQAGFVPEIVYVRDHTGATALEIVHMGSKALAYICLSDEIALTVRQLLAARGEDLHSRVLGFDNSHLAEEHGFSSVSQGLEKIGLNVWQVLDSAFGQGSRRAMSKCRIVRMPLKVIDREGSVNRSRV